MLITNEATAAGPSAPGYAPRVRVEVADEVFVRARRRDVHPYARDLTGYGAWWPGTRSRPAPGGGAALELRAPGRLARTQRLRAHIAKERPSLGVLLSVRGPFAGTAEWYYLDEPDGTRVHYLLRAETGDRGARRRVAAHRAAVRAGLHALKDLLESRRPPGAEPDAALLADQADAIAEFQAGVDAHRTAMGRAEGRG